MLDEKFKKEGLSAEDVEPPEVQGHVGMEESSTNAIVGHRGYGRAMPTVIFAHARRKRIVLASYEQESNNSRTLEIESRRCSAENSANFTRPLCYYWVWRGFAHRKSRFRRISASSFRSFRFQEHNPTKICNSQYAKSIAGEKLVVAVLVSRYSVRLRYRYLHVC